MAEEELVIRATLDDRASAGLARLQGNVRQLGTGPQAQALEGMRRQSGEAAEGLTKLSSGFGTAKVAMTGFSATAALIGPALVGMAAAFATSGIQSFADKLNRLAREARATGQDLAQYRANISTLMSGGVTEQEAAAIIQRFSDVQEELRNRGSQIRRQILAATPLEGRDEMQQWLNNVMVAPAEDAMEMVRVRGEQIREGAGEQARAQALAMGATLDEANRAAERAGAEAQRTFLKLFGAEALMHVVEPFRKATEEERKIQEDRAAAAAKWEAAMRPIRGAWRDIKETVASIAIEALTPAVQAIGTGMRAAADAVRVIERWMKDPDAGGLDDLLTRIETQFSSWAPIIRPIKEFFEDPGQGLVNLLKSTENQFANMKVGIDWSQIGTIQWGSLLGQGEGGEDGLEAALLKYFVDSWKEGLNNVGTHWSGIWAEGMANMRAAWEPTLNNMRQTWEAWTGPIREFFENPGQGILDLLGRAGAAIASLIPQPIRDFFTNPSEGIVDLINRAKAAALDLIPDSVMQFFRGAVEGLIGLIDRIKTALSDMIPAPLRKLLGIGETPAPGVQQLQQAIEQSQIVVPQPAAGLPEETPPDWLVSGFQRGGPLAAGQTALVGERGPELFTPGGGGSVLSNENLQSALRWGIYGAGQLMHTLGIAPGAGGIGHAVSRAHGMEGQGVGDIMRGLIPGMGGLETIRADQLDPDNPLRTRLRAMLGIEDPGEPTRWQQSALDRAMAAGLLDESAAQQVNVSGTGRIRVDVRAPEGTTVDANGEGLFKTTEIMRQTQMLPAEYGPAAATGVNAGTGTLGTGG